MKIEIGKTYGTRKILSIIGQRGKIVHYKVRCTKCGFVRTMSDLSLKRDRSCNQCRLKQLNQRFNLTYQKTQGKHKFEY